MIQDLTHAVVLLVVIGGWLVFWIAAASSILRQPGSTGSERTLWIILAIVLPVVGPLAWFIWGRPRRNRPGPPPIHTEEGARS